MPQNAVFSFYSTSSEEALFNPGCRDWFIREPVVIDRLWNGSSLAEAQQRVTRTSVASVWNENAVFFRFQAAYDRLNTAPELGPEGPHQRLWDFDVVEVFIKPAGTDGYFEIEVSPLGQWVDLFVLKPRTHLDWDWRSRLVTRVWLDDGLGRWNTILKLPFSPMREKNPGVPTPAIGSVWRVNFFRAAGTEPNRLYLAWSPTFTEAPDFHVPEAFGNLVFLSKESLE